MTREQGPCDPDDRHTRDLEEAIVEADRQPQPRSNGSSTVDLDAVRQAKQHSKRRAGPSDAPPKPKPNGAAPSGASWLGALLCSDRGKVIDCLANVAIVLRLDPALAGKVFYDELRETPVVLSLPWRATRRLREITDVDDLKLAEWCQLHVGIMVKPTTALAALQLVASENRINPLRDHLDRLKWDDKPRLDRWLVRYLGAEDTPYIRTVGRKALIAGIARVYRPGCKVDNLLVLEGEQDQNKSNACAALALDDDWFSDEIADIGTKDSAQDLAGKWIIEIAELSAMQKREVERVKAFLSRRISRYRPSYGRRSQDFPRRCMFIGTTNSDEYLSDPTGGRRFWCVRTGRIDLAALRRDAPQLWAEAVSEFHAGKEWWLLDHEKPAAKEEQELRRKADPWEDRVLQVANALHVGERTVTLPTVPPETVKLPAVDVTIPALLHHAVSLDIAKRDQAAATRVGNILTAAGWQRRAKRIDKRFARYYVPPPLHPVAPEEE